MIRLRSAVERPPDRRRNCGAWLREYPQHPAGLHDDGLGTLQVIRIPPGAGMPPHPRSDAELVTYVRDGALAYEDSSGRLGIIRAGEFSRVTGGPGIFWSETNASRTEWAHVFQIWLGRAGTSIEPGREQKRFSAAERRGRFCVIASRDGRKGSLRVHRDALVYSAIFSPGQHVVHELPPGRSAWLHMVQGEMTLGDIVLSTGYGVSVAAERAISFTALRESEILLLHRDELAR